MDDLSLLFVCHGNINRSPAAHVVARACLSDDYRIESAGIKAKPGACAARKMRIAMSQRFYELGGHRASLLDEAMVDRAGLIVVMTPKYAKHIRDTYGRASVLLGHYLVPQQDRIADPGFMARNDPRIDEVADQIVEATRRLCEGLE